MAVCDGPADDAMRDMEAAADTVSRSNLAASEYRQMGFMNLAEFLKDNAKAAERWLVKAAKNYPRRTDSAGKAF